MQKIGAKKIQNLLSEQSAQSAALFLKYSCYIVICSLTFFLIVSFAGRQTFILHTSTGTYDSAIYAEKSHDGGPLGFFVSLEDEIYVITNQKIDLVTHIGLSAMYAVDVIPSIICFWFLSKVFNNISKGRIFTEQNAHYLLYYGLIHIAAAVLVPLIKLLICPLANLFTSSQISISVRADMNDLIPNIAFIVAAYIIHYGVHLQDEADHTL